MGHHKGQEPNTPGPQEEQLCPPSAQQARPLREKNPNPEHSFPKPPLVPVQNPAAADAPRVKEKEAVNERKKKARAAIAAAGINTDGFKLVQTRRRNSSRAPDIGKRCAPSVPSTPHARQCRLLVKSIKKGRRVGPVTAHRRRFETQSIVRQTPSSSHTQNSTEKTTWYSLPSKTCERNPPWQTSREGQRPSTISASAVSTSASTHPL